MSFLGQIGQRIKGAWEALDFFVQCVGGWAVVGAVVSATGAAVWAFITDYGPLSIILFFYVLALAMIVLEEATRLWRKWRQASEAHVAVAVQLRRLTKQGEEILINCNQKRDPQGEMLVWTHNVLKCMEDEPFNDYYGFETISMQGRLDKLRRITMRYGAKHGIMARQVLDFERRENEERNKSA